MARKLPKDPMRAWRNAVAAVKKAMGVLDFQDFDELRIALVKYRDNLARPPAERLPEGEKWRSVCQEVWDALLETGLEDPLEMLERLAEEFFQQPNLKEMERAVERYDHAHPSPDT